MRQISDPRIISELLAEAGVGKPKQNGKSWILTCPRCLKKDKLYIRKKDGRFACWVCKERDGFQGAAEYALTELTGRTVSELQKLLYGFETATGFVALDLDITDFFDDEDDDDLKSVARTLPHVMENPDFRDLDSQWGDPGVKYLESRGVPLDVALRYGIKYWPSHSRIVFPVKSKGKLLGWQSRTIKPHEFIDEETGEIIKIPKALTYEGLAKEQCLMFADNIIGEHAILGEGPLDALKADLCGGNVASLGKAVSMTQLNLLRCSGIKRLYLALDPDASIEMQKMVSKLSGDLELYDMRPDPSTDLGAMSFEEVYELYRRAPRVTSANIFLYLKGWNER
jgi:hypothetical protein